jgi:hypothetical protein
MRTKTLLLSGVVAALSGASLMAQVYSVNVVGYINVTIPPGFSIVADQLYANGQGTPQYLSPLLDSQIGTDGTAPLANCVIYKYIAGTTSGSPWSTFVPDPFNTPIPWDQAANLATLNPGEAVFIHSFNTTNFSITFVGTVPQGNNLTNTAIAHGFSLASSIIPQAGRLDVDLGFPEVDNDTVYIYNPSTDPHPGYVSWVGDQFNLPAAPWDASAGYEPANPTVAVGQGFFYLGLQTYPLAINPGTASAGTASNYTNMWVRSFTVQ